MKNQSWIIALAMSTLLGACAGPGKVMKISVTMPEAEKATIVAHDQKALDWMLDEDQLALNYMVKGDVTDKQLAAVAEAERACRIYTKTVRPNNLVAVVSGATVYALANGVGIGLGAKAFAGAKYRDYQRYGAAAGAFGGAANGIIALGGQTYTFENCGQEIFSLFPGYKVRIVQKSPY
jgi:hypothetical protein